MLREKEIERLINKETYPDAYLDIKKHCTFHLNEGKLSVLLPHKSKKDIYNLNSKKLYMENLKALLRMIAATKNEKESGAVEDVEQNILKLMTYIEEEVVNDSISTPVQTFEENGKKVFVIQEENQEFKVKYVVEHLIQNGKLNPHDTSNIQITYSNYKGDYIATLVREYNFKRQKRGYSKLLESIEAASLKGYGPAFARGIEFSNELTEELTDTIDMNNFKVNIFSLRHLEKPLSREEYGTVYRDIEHLHTSVSVLEGDALYESYLEFVNMNQDDLTLIIRIISKQVTSIHLKTNGGGMTDKGVSSLSGKPLHIQFRAVLKEAIEKSNENYNTISEMNKRHL